MNILKKEYIEGKTIYTGLVPGLFIISWLLGVFVLFIAWAAICILTIRTILGWLA